jgi:hypothetical protein
MKRTFSILSFLLLVLAVTPGVMRSRAETIGPPISHGIVSFTATPRTVKPGESVTLQWETRGATSVAIEWGPERNPRGPTQKRMGLPPSGAMTLQPEEDTVYVLECDTPEGQTCMSASTRVHVN